MLTIFFATGVGVAIVLYAARPRQRAAAAIAAPSSAIEAYSASEPVQAVAMPEVTAAETPVVETSAAPEELAPAEIASPSLDVAAVAQNESAIISTMEATHATEVSASAAAPVEVSAHTAGRAQRAHRRRSSATGRGHTRSSQRRKR